MCNGRHYHQPMPYSPIIGTLAYLWCQADDTILMVYRTGRPDDEHLGKYNGLGGKLEADEDVVAGIKREIQEEANLTLTSLALRGTISWPGFGKNGEDWLGFVFLATEWHGTEPATNEEGRLEWIDRKRLVAACSEDPATRLAADLPMWEGDRFFLPLVFDPDPRPFHGVMPYYGGSPNSWTYHRI